MNKTLKRSQLSGAYPSVNAVLPCAVLKCHSVLLLPPNLFQADTIISYPLLYCSCNVYFVSLTVTDDQFSSSKAGSTIRWRRVYKIISQLLSDVLHITVTFLPVNSVSLFIILGGSGGPKSISLVDLTTEIFPPNNSSSIPNFQTEIFIKSTQF